MPIQALTIELGKGESALLMCQFVVVSVVAVSFSALGLNLISTCVLFPLKIKTQ